MKTLGEKVQTTIREGEYEYVIDGTVAKVIDNRKAKIIPPPNYDILENPESYMQGRKITFFSTHEGSYGSGGPGFVGFYFQNRKAVLCLWGVERYLFLNDSETSINDNRFAWQSIKDKTITDITIESHSFRMTLNDGTILEFKDTQNQLIPKDDLRKAFILVPIKEIVKI